MSMMVSFVLSFFPRDVLDEILNLIESVSEDFPSYFYNKDYLMDLTHSPMFSYIPIHGTVHVSLRGYSTGHILQV